MSSHNSKFGITESNVELYREALIELRTHLEKLVEMTREYPVVCVFGSFRAVFENRESIESVIAELALELEQRWSKAA